MTVLLLTRTAVVSAVTGAVLLSGVAVAGGAAAAKPSGDPDGTVTTSVKDDKVLDDPKLTVPHGRKLG